MKTILAFFICTIFSIACNAQNDKTFPPPPGTSASTDTSKDDRIFSKVEFEAQFPGGDAGWRNFLIDNLKLTKIGKKLKFEKGQKRISETVIVKFIVSKDGSISEVTIENEDANPLFKAEAIRVIKDSPNWKPAIQNGRKVNAYRRQPITFVFDKE
jgi:protein TonB